MLQELPKDLNNESGGRHCSHVAEEGGSEAVGDHESYGKDFVEEFKKDIEKQANKHTAEAIVKDHFSSFLKGAGKWLLYGGLALGALWLWANYGGNFKKKW